ncbi:MAG: menaquinone biosynthesis protein [Fibrobacteraceae bacterium]|nr:menaquinone biosynthesis protein [Fibrobacteraceae bacterium]
MRLRVGRIPFLVCAPFFFDFLGREGCFPDVDFVDGPPSDHCKGLKNGSIHLSPASSITFAQKPGAFVLSPELCTSCSFEVRSVKLFSKFPVEKLGGRKVLMSFQSQTSVALVRILLECRFGIRPDYKEVLPGVASRILNDFTLYGNSFEEVDACVLIGDHALEENQRHRFEFSYDLGSLWQEWQGLPFVFGAWIIAKEALVPELRPTLVEYMENTRRSIEKFRLNPSAALDRWLAKYPVCLPRSVVEDYYGVLDYHFTEDRKQSLSLFFEYAKKLGLVEISPKIEFL